MSAEGLADDSGGTSRAFLSDSHFAKVSAGTAGSRDAGKAGGVGPSGAGSGAQ